MSKPLPAKWYDKAPRLATIAKWINANTTLHAWIEEGFCDTDRKYKGSRIRFPGKGRTGNHLFVTTERVSRHAMTRAEFYKFEVISHNAAETYRSNDEVVTSLDHYLKKNPKRLIATKPTP